MHFDHSPSPGGTPAGMEHQMQNQPKLVYDIYPDCEMNLVHFIKHLSVFKNMISLTFQRLCNSKYSALVNLSGSLISQFCKLAN